MATSLDSAFSYNASWKDLIGPSLLLSILCFPSKHTTSQKQTSLQRPATATGKKELILVFFVRVLDLRLFGFVCFLFLLVSGKGCGLWLWHSLDFCLTFVVTTFLRHCVFAGLFSSYKDPACRLFGWEQFSCTFCVCIFHSFFFI